MSFENDRRRWSAALTAGTRYATQIEEAALLEGALTSGFLYHCAEPVSLADLAASWNLEQAVVEAICAAFRAMGVLDVDARGRVVVSEVYAPLLSDGMYQRILDRLGSAAVRARILRSMFTGEVDSYWSLEADERLALAVAATTDARTKWGRDRMADSAPPEWTEALAGGRFLDFGCGVGGAICARLVDDPTMTAVGVDRAENLIVAARARARELGVDDRCRFEVAAAEEFHDPDGFDAIFWPQTFYARAGRRAALGSAFQNLRPGGVIMTAGSAVRHREGEAQPAIDVLVRTLWGVPQVSLDDLCDELRTAGFVDISAPQPSEVMLPFITARRPI